MLWAREGSTGFHREQLGHGKLAEVKDLFSFLVASLLVGLSAGRGVMLDVPCSG